MITELKPYPEMKDSSVEWLGEVPEHWELVPLGRILTQRKEKNDPIKTTDILSLSLKAGVIPYAEKKPGGNKAKEDLSSYMLAYPGDIVLNSMNVVVGSVGLSKYFGAVSPVYYMLRPRYRNDLVEYFDKIFQYVGFQRSLFGLGNGIMFIESKSSGKLNTIRLRIPMTKLKKVISPQPSLTEQTAIVRFLDHATNRIERYIRTKEKLIALLEEQKQIFIHQAVTGQIDVRTGQPYPAYQDSGVGWLGEVPEHWAVRKLGSLFRRQGSGTTPPQENYFGGPVSWVMSGDLNDGKLKSTNRTVTRRALNELSALKMYPAQSLVVAMYGATIGRTGILLVDACTNQACFVLTDPFSEVNTTFFQAALVSARRELIRCSFGGGQPNINAEVLRAFRVPLPPISEQNAIVSYLDKTSYKIDKAITQAQREIELLCEYSNRLISDVVTGKLDVREAAAKLPQETDKSTSIDDSDNFTYREKHVDTQSSIDEISL